MSNNTVPDFKSPSAIKKVLVVLEYILERAELKGAPTKIWLKKTALNDITLEEFKDIIDGLFGKDILKNQSKIYHDVVQYDPKSRDYDIIDKNGSEY